MNVGGGGGVRCGVAVNVGWCVAVGLGVAVPATDVPVGKREPDGFGVMLSDSAGMVGAIMAGLVAVSVGIDVCVAVVVGVGEGGKETIVTVTDDGLSTASDGVTRSRAASVAAWAPTLGLRGANRMLPLESAP
ncbi:MAG: hypothetical protein P8186_17470 [Anaerolineae bacterium]